MGVTWEGKSETDGGYLSSNARGCAGDVWIAGGIRVGVFGEAAGKVGLEYLMFMWCCSLELGLHGHAALGRLLLLKVFVLRSNVYLALGVCGRKALYRLFKLGFADSQGLKVVGIVR